MNENEDLLRDLRSPGSEASLEIPEFLKRDPKSVEKIPDVPVEIERQFVSVEEEGGNEIVKE